MKAGLEVHPGRPGDLDTHRRGPDLACVGKRKYHQQIEIERGGARG